MNYQWNTMRTGSGPHSWQRKELETWLIKRTINLGKSELICYLQNWLATQYHHLKIFKMRYASEKLLIILLLSFANVRVCCKPTILLFICCIVITFSMFVSHCCCFSYSVISDSLGPMDSWQDGAPSHRPECQFFYSYI